MDIAIKNAPQSALASVGGGSPPNRLIFILLSVLVAGAFLTYFLTGHSVSGSDTLVMPLDDTYIHFQYARMIAEGHPFRYLPTDAPTSGATSLIYPFLLAAGYVLGFKGMALSLWAVSIGGLMWLGSSWLVYQLVKRENWQAAVLAAAIFAISGGLSWAFMSGMETGVMIFACLLTLYFVMQQDLRGVLVAATLAAVTRPEGAVIALGALVYCLFITPRRRWLLLILPLLAVLIQPALNYLLTGSVTASGMQAKSYLYNVPFDLGNALLSILGSFARTWGELLTGFDRDNVLYMVPLLPLLLLGIGLILKQTRWLCLLILFWITGLFGAASILETSFWQFKRYQQPVYTMLIVVAGWVISMGIQRRGRLRGVAGLALAAYGAVAALTFIMFVSYYRDNVREVASLQLPMARYVQGITTTTDRIAVHDIGVMAYAGERSVYDVVGLATANAAKAWRAGPGAVYEALNAAPNRPAYFAIYDEPHGLSYFKNTTLWKDVLRAFPSTNPPRNVASASANQIVVRADWKPSAQTTQPQTDLSRFRAQGFTQVDSVNVADDVSEKAHGYQVEMRAGFTGYATEFFDLPTLVGLNTQTIPDGGRLITQRETMTLQTEPNQDLLWIVRVHPRLSASLTVSVNGQPFTLKVQPGDLGGHWLEIPILIPRSLITSTQTRLSVSVDGTYMPYYHWFYQGIYQPETIRELPPIDATFGKHVTLLGTRLTPDEQTHTLHLAAEWQADNADFDAKLFVHVYKDASQPPVTQYDNRAGGGTLPPANWLPGILRDTYDLPLPTEPGEYKVAIGMYNPLNQTRYSVTDPRADSDNRLFIGTLTIK